MSSHGSMSECWDEGGLRAYCDRELPPEDLARVAAHLGACAECHKRYNELAARAVRVSSIMGALAFEAPAAVAPVLPRRRWVQPVAAAGLALAAALALAYVLIPKRAERPQPVASPRVERVNRPIQAETTTPEPAGAVTPASVRTARAKSPHPAKAPQTDYYLALDDEPIEMGVVARVALDGSAAVQADVIFDAEGRPRAIRPVKLTSK